MENKPRENRADDLPANATEFIRQVVREMRYRRKARRDVEMELTAHFEDELRDCPDPQERQKRAQRLVEQFGDVQLLAVLCRRAKKRCRPLWASAVVRTGQGLGVLLLLFVLYTVWFVAGRPRPTVDYVALLNQMGRPQIVARDNAWPHYEKAIALLVGPDEELRSMEAFARRGRPDYPGFAALPEKARRAIAQWVQENEAAWQEFRTASLRPYCQRPYACDPNAKEPWMLNVQMPPLAPIRDVARVGIWRSRLALEHGDVSRALDDCLTVARAAPHWQTRGTLIEQLVGIALSRLAHEEILALVHERVLAPVQLAELQRKISALYPDRYPSIDMESERLVLLDTIQRVFTNSGPGGGHLAPLAAKSLAVTGHDDFPEDLTGPWLTALGMIHAGRDDTVAKVEQIFELQAKCAKLTPYERYTADRMGADRILDSLPKYRYALIHSLAPALDRAADLAFQGRGLHEATLTILALHRYRAEKGRYPVSLGELQRAGYLEVLPVDPYRNGSLVYHVTNDDFTLYSLSRNFQDNGGRPALDRKGRRQKWADGGAGPVVLPIAFS